MEVPSAYVQFLRSLMPRKPRSEIYTILGLQKQGKALFYRDYLQHLKHSSAKTISELGVGEHVIPIRMGRRHRC